MMKVMIPWSGGKDSTYLVYKALKEGHEVYAPYFEFENNIFKIKRELIARSLLEQQFKKEFPKASLKTDCGVFKFGAYGTGKHFTDCWSQPVVWQVMLMYFHTLYQDENIDEIQLGYVMGDQMCSFQPELRNLRKAIGVFTNPFNKKLKVTTPLLKTTKLQISIEMPEKYKVLAMTCESPDHDYCGACDPCIHRYIPYKPDRKSIMKYYFGDYMYSRLFLKEKKCNGKCDCVESETKHQLSKEERILSRFVRNYDDMIYGTFKYVKCLDNEKSIYEFKTTDGNCRFIFTAFDTNNRYLIGSNFEENKKSILVFQLKYIQLDEENIPCVYGHILLDTACNCEIHIKLFDKYDLKHMINVSTLECDHTSKRKISHPKVEVMVED